MDSPEDRAARERAEGTLSYCACHHEQPCKFNQCGLAHDTRRLLDECARQRQELLLWDERWRLSNGDVVKMRERAEEAEADVLRLLDEKRRAYEQGFDSGHIAGREKSPTMRENRELRERAEKAEAENAQARAVIWLYLIRRKP